MFVTPELPSLCSASAKPSLPMSQSLPFGRLCWPWSELTDEDALQQCRGALDSGQRLEPLDAGRRSRRRDVQGCGAYVHGNETTCVNCWAKVNCNPFISEIAQRPQSMQSVLELNVGLADLRVSLACCSGASRWDSNQRSRLPGRLIVLASAGVR